MDLPSLGVRAKAMARIATAGIESTRASIDDAGEDSVIGVETPTRMIGHHGG